ncbi:type II toxin-antitoxin system PemK/MazF family toxin [Roseomonas sp. OT10]|uniref:type II toxin-antitoxin system PemK/MazF family toxin n=1 Tax=Roseomonas cutis TaxID=2897332 RepID=UPI001E2E2C54|nr:type II toxin-antitoxin system PemK/MazF family toxin [Roseomonas sp. OT10]UFN49145.1 type II toxin-antitoxin system PemK/MazF family toxin [Roseomonas sp. OT10]
MSEFRAGHIVIADWRDAQPREANKRRPAVVVQDDGLFGPGYPAVILVPITEDAGLAIPDLSVRLEPTAENGCSKPSFAVSHFVTTTSVRRVQATPSRITPEQLATIRAQIALALGIG